MEAFGIFQGGGVRGIGLVGALKVATEEYGWNFSLGVAGTSAGSIIASLYSSRWPVEEMEKELKQVNFMQFLDGFEYADAQKAVQQFNTMAGWLTGSRFEKVRLIVSACKPPGELNKLIKCLVEQRGLFVGAKFVDWLDNCLKRYLGAKDRVRFQDIHSPLKVVATNLQLARPEVFSKSTTPDYPVADAVRASIGIPFFFRPQSYGSSTLVDGGLISNYPAWVFDEERQKLGIAYPTVGFRLVEDATKAVNIAKLPSFARVVLEAGIGSFPGLETRRIERLIEIAIPTNGVSTVDFALSDKSKDILFNNGRLAAHEILKNVPVPKAKEQIELQLESACRAIRDICGTDKHLRANIFLPSRDNRVKIFYSYNMNSDPDRELELDMGAGATGRCWLYKKTQLVDLREVSEKASASPTYTEREWKMKPHEQAAVRRTLRSLLCVPILSPTKYRDGSEQPELIGVLNFDSDNQVSEILFHESEVVEIAEKYARVISNLLRP